MLTSYVIYAICQAYVVTHLFRDEVSVKQNPLPFMTMLAVLAPLVTVGLVVIALDMLAHLAVKD